jgi:peptidyl-prolyl cis-trans isomerase D
MLQKLREKFSGWILILIVVILSVPFALFGIEGYFQTQVDTYVAKVNEAEIQPDTLRERLNMQRQQMRQFLGPDADVSFVDSPENKRRLLDGLVDEELRYQDARGMGVEVPAARLQEEILAIDAFKPAGVFDPDTYQRILQANGLSPQGFEARLARELVAREIVARMGASVFVTDAEVDAWLRLNRQTRSFKALRLNAADQVLESKPTEDEVKAHFEAHRDDYKTPETVVAEYVEVRADALEIAAPTEEQLLEEYEKQSARYVVPEQRLTSHILVEVASGADAEAQKVGLAKAEALLAEIRGGKDFAEVAKTGSDDIGSKEQGGDLGWIERGTNDPAFEDALFALEAGQVSEPVLGSNGYHLIQLREVRAESRRPFEEVRDEIAKAYDASARESMFLDLAGRLVDEIQRDPQSLEGPASKLGLTVQKSEPFARTGGSGIAANPKVLEEAYSELVLERGLSSDLIELGPSHVVALRIAERKLPEPRDFDAVRSEIEAKLELDAMRKQMVEQAKALEERMAAGTSLDEIATELGRTPEVADAVVRSAATPDPAIIAEAFKLPRPGDSVVRRVVSLGEDSRLLIELSSVVDGDPAAADASARDAARSELQGQWSEAEARAYVQALRKQAQIRIVEDRM